MPRSLSLALGSGTVTPLQLATGFAVFANGGYRVPPYVIDKIVDQSNKVLYQMQAQALGSTAAPQVITPQNAYLMNNALQNVITEGTARAALSLTRSDLAGKTGSTNKLADAWFTGFNTQLLASVWVGYDNLSPLHEHGAAAALPIWINFMRYALHGAPLNTLAEPANIVTARINATTGLLAPSKDTDVLFEHFTKENQPTEYAHAANPSETNQNNTANTTQTGDADQDSGPLF